MMDTSIAYTSGIFDIGALYDQAADPPCSLELWEYMNAKDDAHYAGEPFVEDAEMEVELAQREEQIEKNFAAIRKHIPFLR